MLCHAPTGSEHTRTLKTLALQALDTTIRRWEGKPAPRISALRAPWLLCPNLEGELRTFLRQWYFQALAHHVPCQPPSLKTIFVKNSSVVGILCNHKQAIDEWGHHIEPKCTCQDWWKYQAAAYGISADHWVLIGSLLGQFLPSSLAVIVEGSLQNKVFPSKHELTSTLQPGLKQWYRDNGLPSFPRPEVQQLQE